MTRHQIARTELFTNLSGGHAVDLTLAIDGVPLPRVQQQAATKRTAHKHSVFTVPRDADRLTITGKVRLDGKEHSIDQTHAIADLGEITWHIHDPGAPVVARIQAMEDFIAEFRDQDDDSEGLFRAVHVGPKQTADLKRTEALIGHSYPQALYDVLHFEYHGWGSELWYPGIEWMQPYTVTDWLKQFSVPQETLNRLGIYQRLYDRALGTVHWDTHGGNLRVLGWVPGGVERIEAYQLGLFPDRIGPQTEGVWFEAYDDDLWRPHMKTHLDGRLMNAEDALLDLLRRQVLAQMQEMVQYEVLGEIPDDYVILDSAGPVGRLYLWVSDRDGQVKVGLTQH